MFRSMAALALALVTSAARAETYAIQAGRLIVDAAVPERGASTVIVTGGRIVRIEDGATAPAGATVVDERAVLDRVDPGTYRRVDALGAVRVRRDGKLGMSWHVHSLSGLEATASRR